MRVYGAQLCCTMGLQWGGRGDVGVPALYGGVGGAQLCCPMGLQWGGLGDVGAPALYEGVWGAQLCCSMGPQWGGLGDVGVPALYEGVWGPALLLYGASVGWSGGQRLQPCVGMWGAQLCCSMGSQWGGSGEQPPAPHRGALWDLTGVVRGSQSRPQPLSHSTPPAGPTNPS